jgi:hypothetical protein
MIMRHTENVTVCVKTADRNMPLTDTVVRVTGKSKKSLPTDSSGCAVFLNLQPGKIMLEFSCKDNELDHLQYRGRSHHSTELTLHPGEHLEVMAFMRKKRRIMKKKLDQLINDYSSSRETRIPKVVQDFREVMHLMESTLEHRGFERAMMRLADVRLQAEALEHELIRLDHEMDYRVRGMLFTTEDANELAVQIQEYLGLPKFKEQHPNAGLLWHQCLSIAHALQSRISARNDSLQWLRRYLRQEDSIKNNIDNLTENLHHGAVDDARSKLRPVQDQLLGLHSRIMRARKEFVAIDSYTHQIDSPDKLSLLKSIICP